MEGLTLLIAESLYYGSSDAAEALLSDQTPDLDERLKALILQVLQAQLIPWREASIAQRPSLPRFVEADWRVDVKSSSDLVARMTVPTVLVDILVEEQIHHTQAMPATRHVHFEMSKGFARHALRASARFNFIFADTAFSRSAADNAGRTWEDP
jgi:hypothetical protein